LNISIENLEKELTDTTDQSMVIEPELTDTAMEWTDIGTVLEDNIGENCGDTSPENSTTPGPGNVELIPRPVRNRQRPAKYQDYETKFVRMLRKSRE